MTRDEFKAGEAICPLKKHKGSSLWVILDDDPKYIDWMLGKAKEDDLRANKEFISALLLYGNSSTVQTKLEEL
ncbi:MAG: hypothetical protein ACTSSK_03550 [Candidatus Heimdallarchaeota archaeon]